MFDITVYIVVIIAIICRLVLMKGSFVLPTFYKCDNVVTFNLGSISTIIIGIMAAIGLMYSSPELFSNWYVAGITAYTAPQIVDGIVSTGTRMATNPEPLDDDEIIND